jgi:hypothetical protein
MIKRFIESDDLRNIPYKDAVYFLENIIGGDRKKSDGQGNGSHIQYRVKKKDGFPISFTLPYQDPIKPVYIRKIRELYYQVMSD